MAGSAFFFSLMSLFVKLAGEGLPPMQIVLARCVLTLALSWLMLRRAGLSARGSHHGLLIARGLFGFTALSLYYFAITRLPLGDVTAIHFTSPVFVALLAAVLLRERTGKLVLAGMALSLLGVGLIARPSFLFGAGTSTLDPWGVAAALVSATFSAAAYTLVRKLRETEDPIVVVYWFSLVAVFAALPLVVTDLVWPTAREWLLLLAVGVTTQIAQVYLTRGLHLEVASRASTVGYLQIVFAFTWGWLVFGDAPTLWSLAGAALVLASVLTVSLRK
jgi:drug/metabolite transporter (DMT)-like permease